MSKGDILKLVLVALVFVGAASLGAIIGEDVAIRTLSASGFSNITIIDKAWFAVGLRGCSEKDLVRFTAQATNPAGQRVEVCVCAGLFKGGTVRVR